MPQLAIIADDLTGALDAAAPFAAVNGGVTVVTRTDALREALARGPGVIAVSTRSREIAPGIARARVEAVLAALPPGVRIVKKIDSRLKGNIPSELEPFAGRPLVVLPAIPDFGRVVAGGALQGFGVNRPVPVRKALGDLGLAASVPDTPDQATMRQAVEAAPAEAVLVGARGLAQALAAMMGLAAPAPDPSLRLPLCFVVGSTDPITLAQVEAVRAAEPGARYLAAPSGAVPPCPAATSRLTLIQATPSDGDRPERVAARLAEGAAPCLRTAQSMLLTGGATAEAVLDALGITTLRVEGEALPGMPRCRADGQIIVTKSGGFGDPDAFVRLAGIKSEVT